MEKHLDLLATSFFRMQRGGRLAPRNRFPARPDRRILTGLLLALFAARFCPSAHAASIDNGGRIVSVPGGAFGDAERLDQMASLLADVEKQSTRLTLWLAAANATMGAANAVGGSFALKRGAVGPAAGAFVGAGFAAASGIVGLTFARAPFRSVHDAFVARRKQASAAVAIAEAEHAWRTKAASAHAFRIGTGAILASAGVLMVGFSTANLVANLPLPSRGADTNSRAALGGALLGLSGFLFVNGLTLLVTPDPIESSWRSYALMQAKADRTRATIRCTPLPHGAAVEMAVIF